MRIHALAALFAAVPASALAQDLPGAAAPPTQGDAAPATIATPATPATPAAPATIERRLAAMGTSLVLEVDAPTRAIALAASEAAVRAIEAAEARLSTWRDDSELARLNAQAPGEPLELSPELARDLARARALSFATDGAFDPGVGALVHAYGLRAGGRTPSPEELERALAGGGVAELALDGRAATRLRAGLVLEEGAFGKGVGLEDALVALRAAGATAAVVDLGGQVAVLGAGEPARFAVADPSDRARAALEIEIDGGSLSTTGNSERGVEVAGARAAHVIDPRTGRPAQDFGSVTVWTDDPVAADAYSTALFVMGPDAGLAWAAGRADVEALFLVARDGALEARATAGLAGRLTALDPALALSFERPLAAVGAPSAAAPAAPTTPTPGARPQDGDVDERLSRLESQMDAVSHDIERFSLGDLVPPVGDSYSGLGPAASKVYGKDGGLSIGGYGESIYTTFSGEEPAEWDALRTILYFGYKFNEDWVLNTELEFEHAGDEVSVEFSYIDYLGWESVHLRAGLLLIPMGFINELHEPTTFLGAVRPETERRIIPSTWRENGVGVYGDAGPFAYRAYVVNGFDASGFSDAGLRGGRQSGGEALAEDLALVARLDYVDVPGLLVGVSGYTGDSGQDQAGLGDATTTIYEAHAEWRRSGLWLRALYAMADVDDVDELNAGLGLVGAESVGEELEGFYAEAGYDVMELLAPESGHEVSPYVRFESIDTQAEVPTGFASDPANDEDIVSAGVRWLPIPQLVFKAEFADWDDNADRFHVSMGYIF